jgi:hypothetical protein
MYVVIIVNDNDAPPEYCWGVFPTEDECYAFAAKEGFPLNSWRILRVLGSK